MTTPARPSAQPPADIRPAFTRDEVDRILNDVPNWKLGVEGTTNQGRLLNETVDRIRGGDDHLALPAACLLYWAWQQRPLDTQLLNALSGPLGALLPDETARVVAAVREVLDNGPESSRDAGARLGDSMNMGDFEAAARQIDILDAAMDLPPLSLRLRAEWGLFALSPVEAEPLVRSVPDSFAWWRTSALARLAVDATDTRGAAGLYADLWRAMPWNVNLTLTLTSLLHAPTLPNPSGPSAPHDVCLLLYTWNKAGPLAQALEHLAASDTGAAQLVALDNGSTDETFSLLSRELDRRGPQRMRIERLPVNIGAPAARNWLLSLKEVRRCKWLAFLDDDILLPPDWLARLLRTARANPEAGAVGCRVVDGHAPHCLQAADFHLFHAAKAPGGFANMTKGLAVADNGIGTRDTSLFAYTRPCLSVTGCCHLVNARALERAGHFDIRFSPSQFDDLERDLRSALAGMPAVYEGNLVVPHMQHSSLKQAKDPKKIGHIFGNTVKLEHLFSDEEKERLSVMSHALTRDDLATRLDELYERFGG